MKIIIAEEILKPKIEFENLHLNYNGGEHVYKLLAKINNKTVGYLNYGVFEDKPSVKMLEVFSDWLRQGVATALMKHLQQLYPNTEIELGYASKDGTAFLKSLKRQFYPNPKYSKLQKQLSFVKQEIERIKQKSANNDYSETEKLNDLYDQQYDLEYEIEETDSGKWIILENYLIELVTRKNIELKNSKVSKVFLGGNWVKKIKNKVGNTGEVYSKEELLQYQCMQENQNSGIFPPTIIKYVKDKSGTTQPVILQKKVNVDSQASIYHKIKQNIDPIDFKLLLETIANRGISDSIKEEITEAYQILNRELGDFFKRYIEIVIKLNKIRKKYDFEFKNDLNGYNFGLYLGNIVIIDFASPYLKIP